MVPDGPLVLGKYSFVCSKIQKLDFYLNKLQFKNVTCVYSGVCQNLLMGKNGLNTSEMDIPK